jgi:hypothetical protein
MRRLILPFKISSQNSDAEGMGSGFSGECTSGSNPGLCGGVSLLPIDDVSGSTEGPNGPGELSFDGPGWLGWREGRGGSERVPTVGLDPTGNRDPVRHPGFGGGLSACLCCPSNCSVAICDDGMFDICDDRSAGSGLGGGAWSSPGTFGDPLSGSSPANGSNRFCNAVVTAFASRRTSALSRTAAGAASVKLMMESIRMIRLSILCRRIFVGYVT